jgi:hypothetical protein
MSDLDRYIERFGAQVHAAEPPRRRRELAAVAVAALVAAAVLIIAPGGGTRPVDAIAAARAALEADGQILYMKVRLQLDPGVGIAPGAKIEHVNEQWSQSNPKRWRYRGTRTDGSWAEFAYVDGAATNYDSDTNRGRTITGYEDTDPQARAPGLFGVRGGNDPDADLRAMLAAGRLEDTGLVQAHDRTVRRLEGGDRHRSWIYDVDPETFAPVGGAMTLHHPKAPVHTTRFVVEAYERIPLGTDVFTVETKPHPTVTRLTKQQFLNHAAEQRRRLKTWSRCVKRNRGSHEGCGPSPYTRGP